MNPGAMMIRKSHACVGPGLATHVRCVRRTSMLQSNTVIAGSLLDSSPRSRSKRAHWSHRISSSWVYPLMSWLMWPLEKQWAIATFGIWRRFVLKNDRRHYWSLRGLSRRERLCDVPWMFLKSLIRADPLTRVNDITRWIKELFQ